MSTKIFNGYKIDTDGTFLDVQKKLSSVMDEIRKVFDEEYTKSNIIHICEMIDIYDLGKLKGSYCEKELGKTFTPAFFVSDLHQEKHLKIQNTYYRDPMYDFSCSICAIPDEKTGEVFCLFYTERDSYRKVWENKEWVHKYFYWNCTDKPKDLSDEEWKTREEDWDRVLENKAPMYRGLSVELLEHYINMGSRNFLVYSQKKEDLFDKYSLSLEERAEGHAHHEFKDRYWKGKMFENGGWFKSKGEHFRCLFEANDYSKTDEGKEILENIKKEIAPKLKERITVKDAWKEYSLYE